MQNGLPLANWKNRISLLFGRLIGFRVAGNSMSPTLEDGAAVLIKPLTDFHIGDIVLANHPFKQSVRILKRIRTISPEGTYYLTGDNPAESTDSRSFGSIQGKDMIGKAVCRFEIVESVFMSL